MSRSKRPWGVVAAPFILVFGLAGFWGVQAALGMKDTVEDWAYQLEHSSEPVVMVMPNVPLFPPLFVNNQHIGRIEEIVVERTQPRGIDGLQVVAAVNDEYVDRLHDCALRLRVASADPGSLKRALRCTRDTEGLVSFGQLKVSGSDVSVPILVRVGDLPCTSDEVHMGPCGVMTEQLKVELHQLRDELRHEARQIRVELRDVRELKTEIREKVRASIR